ncbi:MAG: prepilin-type N-terminal cleavage/methylation domain-containing protein [Armatimonadetes bacterium]|nr:prepilin-type N-terminal cleavage/methylation domain-containing protein [Armatimonadota bacterium]
MSAVRKTKRGEVSGFTMIELMIVVSVLLILTGLLMPVITSAKRASKRTVCTANLSQISNAILLYSADNDNVFPRGKDCADLVRPGSFPPAAQIESVPLLHHILMPYTKSFATFRCPEDSGTNVVESAFPEKMEFTPSVYEACGSSYEYRTELGLVGAQDTGLKDPSKVNTLADLAGHWHGTSLVALASDSLDDFQAKVFDYRYEIAFADGHVKLLTHSGLEVAWRSY